MFKLITSSFIACLLFIQSASAFVIDNRFYKANFEDDFVLNTVSETNDAFYVEMKSTKYDSIFTILIVDNEKDLGHYKMMMLDNLLKTDPGFNIAKFATEYKGIDCILVPLSNFNILYTYAADGNLKAFIRYEGKNVDEVLEKFFKNFKQKVDLSKVIPNYDK